MTVDDHFRTFPPAHRGPDGAAPYALCPRDKEPLVSTIEHQGAEFLCMVCGTWYGFMAPVPGVPTPELDARHEELRAAFDRGERP